MSGRRTVWVDRVAVGTIAKYVGATARSMGSDPAYGAYPADESARAIVCATWTDARDYLIRTAS